MARKKKKTLREIKRARLVARTFSEFCELLEISQPTGYKYIRLFGLKPFRNEQGRPTVLDPLEVARAYRHETTIEDLAREFSVSESTIRYTLNKIIRNPKKYTMSKELPPPGRIIHILVINALIENEDLLRYPEKIDLPDYIVTSYWRHAFAD